jgi:hypothetical protein
LFWVCHPMLLMCRGKAWDSGLYMAWNEVWYFVSVIAGGYTGTHQISGGKKWCEVFWKSEISKYTRKVLGSFYAIWKIYVCIFLHHMTLSHFRFLHSFE